MYDIAQIWYQKGNFREKQHQKKHFSHSLLIEELWRHEFEVFSDQLRYVPTLRWVMSKIIQMCILVLLFTRITFLVSDLGTVIYFSNNSWLKNMILLRMVNFMPLFWYRHYMFQPNILTGKVEPAKHVDPKKNSNKSLLGCVINCWSWS